MFPSIAFFFLNYILIEEPSSKTYSYTFSLAYRYFMPHDKTLSYPNSISSILQTLVKSPHIRDKVLLAIKIQKSDSGYKKITHRHQASHQLMPLIPKNQQKAPQGDLQERIFTQSGQKKQKKFKKNETLAFYEEKYTEQINRLSSNLCVKQVQQVEKQKYLKEIIQRNSQFQKQLEKRKNSFVEVKKMTKRGLMSPLKKLSHPATIGIVDKRFEDKQNMEGDQKLRLRPKLKPLELKPLVGLSDINLTNISSLLHERRSARKSSVQKPYHSQVRGLSQKNSSELLLKQLLQKKAWEQDFMPWQDTTSSFDQDPKFNSTFNSKI